MDLYFRLYVACTISTWIVTIIVSVLQWKKKVSKELNHVGESEKTSMIFYGVFWVKFGFINEHDHIRLNDKSMGLHGIYWKNLSYCQAAICIYMILLLIKEFQWNIF